jgi:hypothetical protein
MAVKWQVYSDACQEGWPARAAGWLAAEQAYADSAFPLEKWLLF